MSKYLPPFESKTAQAIIDRMRKAGWQQPVVNLAEDDGFGLDLNEEGSKHFIKASEIVRSGALAAGQEHREFDAEAALASIDQEISKIEAKLTPPAFTEQERDTLRGIVLYYVTNQIDGLVETSVWHSQPEA